MRTYRLVGPDNGACADIEARLKRDGHRVLVGLDDLPAEPIDGLLVESEREESGKAFLELSDDDFGGAMSRFVAMIGALQQGLLNIRDGGSLIAVASRGFLGAWGDAHEMAFSAAIIGLMRCVALESMSRQVRSNVIAVDCRAAPGAAATRAGPSGSVADIAAFLLGEESQLINGETLLANRGRSLQMREARDLRK